MAVHQTQQNYEYGSAVRKREQVEYVTREEKIRRRRTENVTSQLTAPYVMIMTLVLICTVFLCINYIQTQASVSARLKHIAVLEKQVDKLVEDNNALELSISPYLDYSYVYQVATEELGMQYAGQDQIITYDSVESEYIKQYEEIPSR